MTSTIYEIVSDFKETMLLLRRANGTKVKGRYLPGTVSTTTLHAATWPTTGPEKLTLPEAVRTQASRTFISDIMLRTAKEPDGNDCDIVAYGGDHWQVLTAEPWTYGGFWRCIGIKRAQSSSIATIYFGVAEAGDIVNGADVQELPGLLSQNQRQSLVAMTAGADEYLWVAYPASFGAASFRVDGFIGGVSLIDADLDVDGVPYRLYRSVQPNLGTVALQVE